MTQAKSQRAQAPHSRRCNGTAAGCGGAFSRYQDRVDVRALLVRLFLHFECLKTLFADGGCTCKQRQTGADRKTSCYGWMSSTVHSARLSPGHFLRRACVFPARLRADTQAAYSYS